MEGRICHDKERENVAARDSQVCDHHTVAYDVPALEHSDVVVGGTVVPGNLVQSHAHPTCARGRVPRDNSQTP